MLSLSLAAALLAAACTAVRDSNSQSPVDPAAAAEDGRADRPAWLGAGCDLPVQHLRLIRRAHFPGRSPDILVVPRRPNFFAGSFESTSHSGPWRYLQNVPLVFYGPGFIRSRGDISLNREITVADLAPTVAELVGLPWPSDRPGRPIREVLVPEDRRARKPKLVVVIAWDGGGWNVLNEWPDAWPNLRSLMKDGSSVLEATVGSSPSVTPAVHATMGTGAWPRRHGIVDIPLRDGDRMVGSFSGRTPRYLKLPTLGDLHDVNVDNAAKIGIFSYKSWHWGMMGHGAYRAGGDKDIAVLAARSTGKLITNTDWYSLPSYVHEIGGLEEFIRQFDLEDGRLDGKWMGHDVLNDPSAVRETPPWVLYQNEIIQTILTNEDFGRDQVSDLFFTNYKQIDEIGHSFNMVRPEMREILTHTDAVLGDLVSFLDRRIGKERWVVAVTADHGQTPRAVTTGAWPIRMESLRADVARHFGVPVDDLFAEQRSTGLWLKHDTLRREGIEMRQISNFLLAYTARENHPRDQPLPSGYRDRLKEKLFDAAFPGKKLPQVWECAASG